jgi:hypothetical protein
LGDQDAVIFTARCSVALPKVYSTVIHIKKALTVYVTPLTLLLIAVLSVLIRKEYELLINQ